MEAWKSTREQEMYCLLVTFCMAGKQRPILGYNKDGYVKPLMSAAQHMSGETPEDQMFVACILYTELFPFLLN